MGLLGRAGCTCSCPAGGARNLRGKLHSVVDVGRAHGVMRGMKDSLTPWQDIAWFLNPNVPTVQLGGMLSLRRGPMEAGEVEYRAGRCVS